MIVTIDFETRSHANIKKVGGYKYAHDPTTQIMCLAYAIGDDPVRIIHPGVCGFTGEFDPLPPFPEDLEEAIKGGCIVEAHNAMFERSVWSAIMVERHGWRPIEVGQWRCSAGLAASKGLPRKLETACQAMRTPHQKNMDGNRIMMKLSKPRKPSKHDPAVWHHDLDDYDKLYQYCMDDVGAERSLSHALKKLPKSELAVWRTDQEINWRGVGVDMEMVNSAIELVKERQNEIDEELSLLTNWEVIKHTKRANFLEWLQCQGVNTDNTQKDTLEELLKGELPDDARKAIELWLEAAKASVKKYTAAHDRATGMRRIHDTIMYCGAHTGRWTAKGVQTQNVKRGFGSKDIDHICEAIIEKNTEWLELFGGNVMEALSLAVRGMFKARKGHKLYASDYLAVEARGTFWLAQQEDALEVFRRGDCIYSATAENHIFFRPVNALDNPFERFVGKQSVLGLGYQMGPMTWISNNHKYNAIIPKDECLKVFSTDYDDLEKLALSKDGTAKDAPDKWRDTMFLARVHYGRLDPDNIHEQLFACYVVQAYRNAYSNVRALWRNIERAAIEAVQAPGITTKCNYIRFRSDREWLYMRLPSGRIIHYREPKLKEVNNWGRRGLKLTHMTVHPKTKKWVRDGTYGGKLTENAVQGLSRDVMAEAMVALEKAGYPPVMTVHDEVVAEVPDGHGSLEEFEEIMRKQPAWATGFPIDTEGWVGERYRK